MAFAALRRAASSAAPLYTRSLSRLSIVVNPFFFRRETTAVSFHVPCVTLFVTLFSSAASGESSAGYAHLLRVIDYEIQCAKESDDRHWDKEIPMRFPFEIQDEKGIVTLRRNFRGENVEVLVSMPEVEDDEDGEQEETPIESSMLLTVNIVKGDGFSLEFSCTAHPDEVTIDSMCVQENKESVLAYRGPDFNDLDDNLQKALRKYLERRGISATTTNFLREYMINKESCGSNPTTISYHEAHSIRGVERSEAEMEAMYKAWLAKYGCLHSDLGDPSRRFEAFKDNLRFIDAHNAAADEGRHSFRVGLNQFSNLTNEEFRAKYCNGYRGRYRGGKEMPDSED